MIPRRIVMVLGLAVAVAGCASPLTTREKGALAGGAIGAGSGALIGSASGGKAGTGALIGAGVGALSGALIGDAIQGAEQKQATATAPPPPSAPPPPAPVVVVPPASQTLYAEEIRGRVCGREFEPGRGAVRRRGESWS